MQIANFRSEESVLVIAEIGNNHEGQFETAERMISEAAQTGVDAVKFQTIIPDRLFSAVQTEQITKYERFSFSFGQFEALARRAEKEGVMFLSTPFDLESVRFLNDLVPAFKISSGDNTFYPLLREVGLTGKPVLLSTGMVDMNDVQRALDVLSEAWRSQGAAAEAAVLHCVTSYPTPPGQANLAAIRAISSLGATPGYSDHTLGVEAAVLSVAVGARVVEKHFTLDKNFSDFRDHKLSADPTDLAEMVRRIREADTLLGQGAFVLLDCEKTVKHLFRRSIVAAEDLSAGQVLTESHLTWVRPEGGLPPGQEAQVLGKTLKTAKRHGEMVLPEDVE
jgi:N-acetylneuraminate synthase/N,N'-diacetyllegionaminate synthase